MNLKVAIIILLLCTLLPAPNQAAELKTRLVRLEFQDEKRLQQFNSRVRLGLSNSLGRQRSKLLLSDEVSNKLDLVYGRVQEILDMHPPRSDLSIVLLPSEVEVQAVYKNQFAAHVGYIAFFSPDENSVYLAVNKVNIRVLAHELAHVVIHHFFHKRPPESIHELLAQHVEKQFRQPTQKRLK